MKNTKPFIKILALILATLMTFSILVSCGGNGDGTDSDADSVAGSNAAPSSGTDTDDGSKPAESETSAADLKPEEIFTFKIETFEGVDYAYIAGVTDAGKELTSIDVPLKYGNIDIVGFNKNCFKDCKKLETLTVHSNIMEWDAALFVGCDKLTRIVMDYADLVSAIAADPSVAEDLFAATSFTSSIYGENSIIEGMPNIRFIFTDQNTYDFFSTDYTWGVYAETYVKE